MADFNRNFSREGRGERRFGGPSFGGRNRMMHKAVCANCGKECEVPFRPSGDRPVYCSDCFEKKGNQEGGPPPRSDRRDFSRPRFEERRGPPPNVALQQNSEILDQLKSMNAKLDKLVKALVPKETPPVQIEPKEMVAEPAVKKPKVSRKKAAKPVALAE